MNCSSPIHPERPTGWPTPEPDDDGRGAFVWLLAAAAFVLGVAMTIAVLCARGWL